MIDITKIFSVINSIANLATKAIKPDSIRERESKINQPVKERQAVEKIQNQDKTDWVARVKTFDLKKVGKRKSITQRELIKYVTELIEWGATIEDIRKTDTQIEVDYLRQNICYPTEIFKL